MTIIFRLKHGKTTYFLIILPSKSKDKIRNNAGLQIFNNAFAYATVIPNL